MKNTLVQDTALTPENLVEATIQRLAAREESTDRTALTLQAAIELATDLLRIRQEQSAMLQETQKNLERLHTLARRRASLLQLTDAYLNKREAFPGEKRLRHVVSTAEPEEAEAFHHN